MGIYALKHDSSGHKCVSEDLPGWGGGGREETRVKHRLNFLALSLFAVLSQPFSNPSCGPQLSPDAWGVAGNPPSPAGALPHPFTTAAGHREGGRFPGNCAGGDRRALTRGALGPSGYPASIGSGNCSPEIAQPPPPRQATRARRKGGERRRFGKRGWAAPHLTPPQPPPPFPPSPRPQGRRARALLPREMVRAKWARPARVAGIWCPLQLAVRRTRAPAQPPAGPAINNAPGEPGVGQSWPVRNPCAAGTAPGLRGRSLQGPCRHPVGEGVLGGLPSSTRAAPSSPWVVVRPGCGTGRSHPGKGDGRPWLGDLTPLVVCGILGYFFYWLHEN